MVWAISLPDLVYVYLSYIQPDSLYLINICIFIEQFGYGFGFTAYMLYLIYFADGEHKNSTFNAHLYRIYGIRHDDSGNGCRLASGTDGIHPFLYMGL